MGVFYVIHVFNLVQAASIAATVVVAVLLYKIASHFLEKVLED